MSNVENNSTQLNKGKLSLIVIIAVAAIAAAIAIITTVLLINRKSSNQFSKEEKSYIIEEVMLYNEVYNNKITTSSSTENEQISKSLYAHTKTLEVFIFSSSFQANKLKDEAYDSLYEITMYGIKNTKHQYYIGYYNVENTKMGVIYQKDKEELLFESKLEDGKYITLDKTKGYTVSTEDNNSYVIDLKDGKNSTLSKEKKSYSFVTYNSNYSIMTKNGSLQLEKIIDDENSIICTIGSQLIDDKYKYTYTFTGDNTTYSYEKY